MSACLMVGPTLPRPEIAGLCDFVCLPPAAMGDVYRCAQARPRAIGIIDGYFEGVPAVWHKEILWAMTQGIHVFGSASMGALRAAELHGFGMRGVGRIFEAYRDGDLEDDDEVAVVHGPAEAGYVALSEPMVNIRATLQQAEASGIVDRPAHAALIDRAKALFYQDRTWQRLLAEGDAPRLRDWLPAGRIDRKRLDALEMIAVMREFLAADPPPLRPAFAFEWTDMWDIAVEAMAKDAAVSDAGGGFEAEWVLDELRLDEAAFEAARRRALLRYLARRGRRAGGGAVDDAARRAAEQSLRARLGLFRQADVARWCAENGLDPSDFARLAEDEAHLAGLEPRGRDLLDQLRLDGDYGRLLAQARDKRAVLAASGREDAAPADCGLAPVALVAWHFATRLGRALPDDLDSYVRRLGLEGRSDFYRALAREWLYSQAGKVEADR